MARYDEIDHTADTGLTVRAATLPEALAAAAEGMFRLMYGEVSATGRRIVFTLPDEVPADLLYDVLAELLWRAEADDLAVGHVEVHPVDDGYRVEAAATPTTAVELVGPPIKAVTWHDLVCEPRDGDWFAQVIFDV